MPRPSKLSAPSPELVLKILRKNAEPLSAYEVLEKARKFGIKSPPIVYRALESLIEMGKVHKINELNSFVACDCNDDHQHLLSVLTICQNCNEVHELHDHKVIDHLVKLITLKINLVKQAVIQLPIICSKCAA
jgi:Fur family transcriptional regulator, zinc uptake regulator